MRGAALAAMVAALLASPAGAAADRSGTIEVEVKYGGAPVVERVKVTRDVERCGTEIRVQRVVVGPGQGLAHAIVSVAGLKGGPASRAGRPAIEQRDCAYQPHAVAMQTGEIDILNADGILHGVRTFSSANPPIGRAQPKYRKTLTERLEKPEIVKIGCDVHPWMLGWIGVFDHPYFAVTDARGTARIEGVPAGRHALEVWHEVLGKQTRTVDVRPGQAARVTVEMKR